MNTYLVNGHVITAKSREELHKVVAGSKKYPALENYDIEKSFSSRLINKVKEKFGNSVCYDDWEGMLVCKDNQVRDNLIKYLESLHVKTSKVSCYPITKCVSYKELDAFVRTLGFKTENDHIIINPLNAIIPDSLSNNLDDFYNIIVASLHNFSNEEKAYKYVLDDFSNKQISLSYDVFEKYDYSKLKDLLLNNKQKVIKAYEKEIEKMQNLISTLK